MITWRLFPFVRILIALSIGIWMQRCLTNLALVFTIILLLSISVILYFDFYRNKLKNNPIFISSNIFIVFFSLGYIRTDINQPNFSIKHYSHYVKDFDMCLGIIQEIPIKRTSQRTDIEIVSLCNSKTGKCVESKGKAVVYFKLSDNKSEQYRPGDKILFKGRLNEVPKNTNPYSFDFKVYLFNRGITHQVYVSGVKEHIIIERNCLSYIYQIAMNVRDDFLRIIRKYIKDPNEIAISSAMILGYRNMVSEDMYKAFSDSGAVHILAVSGMHLGILATALSFFFDRWKSKESFVAYLKYFVALFLLWFFAFITGAAPAMLRAAIMFTIILYAKYFKPSTNVFNVLAFCAIVMLIYDPFMIYQASFQFSFIAMFSLTYFQPFIKTWIVPKNIFAKYIWDLTSVALAAQVLVVPITIYFFHKFPLYFILTGVVSVFLSIIALYVGLAMFVIEYIFSPINVIIGWIFSFIMKAFIASVTLVKEIPFCSIDGLLLSNFELIVVYIFLLLLMLYVSNYKFYLVKGMVAMICIFICTTTFRLHNANHQTKITIYDDRKSNMIDVYDGRRVYGIQFDASKNSFDPFINYNNRIYQSINNSKEIGLSENYIGTNTRKINSFIQLKDKNFLIMNKSNEALDLSNVDYLFLTENIQFNENRILNKNITIIADKSFDQNNLRTWNEKLSSDQINFHSIKKDGSITIEI